MGRSFKYITVTDEIRAKLKEHGHYVWAPPKSKGRTTYGPEDNRDPHEILDEQIKIRKWLREIQLAENAAEREARRTEKAKLRTTAVAPKDRVLRATMPFRLSVDLLTRLAKRAQQDGVSKSILVERALDAYLGK